MRIALLSLTYPPRSHEGIPRQRQVLARRLARAGHDVHVITVGETLQTFDDQGARIHVTPVAGMALHGQPLAAVQPILERGTALLRSLLKLHAIQAVDVVDVPLWEAQGWPTLQRFPVPTVLWLQTTTVQLLNLYGRAATVAERELLRLERDCIRRADSILGDSHSIVAALERDYGMPQDALRSVVHLGIADEQSTPLAHDGVELLVVGRLERRKGTPVLFEALPPVLARHPDVRVRFVGRDNSASDGWLQTHGSTYPDSFRERHPQLVSRVVFEGYVDDERLGDMYRQADILVAPSLYESFGLLYLEGMRSQLPVIAASTAGASEIFEHGADHGALLIRPGDAAELEQALEKLIVSAPERAQLGMAGRRRFESTFTDTVMAERTVEFYAATIARHRRATGRPLVWQVAEALDRGDAVSTIALEHAGRLAELGQPGKVLARQAPDELHAQIEPLERGLDVATNAQIFHYWGYNESTWLLRALQGRKALYYHNITPPHLFPPSSPLANHVRKGYMQLSQVVPLCDLLIGDSRYNLAELASMLREPRPGLVLYPVVEAQRLRAAPYDAALVERIRGSGSTHFLFVGRMAQNKRPDRVMRLFDAYCRQYDPAARLWLVGSTQFDPHYTQELERLQHSLRFGQRITFTGKVSDAELYSYVRAASLFVCASEHEGFCVPIAEAMASGVPVVAYAAGAVPETLNGSGMLVHTWNTDALAGQIADLMRDSSRYQEICEQQARQLERFSSTQALQRMAAAVDFLLSGRESALFERIVPHIS